ncbi:unnamed protein product [Nippostrongylus brasiliensis]|uniref:EB domain-containing protein n=1 Tax=Nippostrongylus brasiliensis TaxID=27835 RepID=A0A158QWZ8_NIPBR|nr:unnamed protein product [Nippostrongylus brasiliensis]
MMLRLQAILLLLLKAAVDASPLAGRMCMTVELYRTADNSSQFYECAPLAQEEARQARRHVCFLNRNQLFGGISSSLLLFGNPKLNAIPFTGNWYLGQAIWVTEYNLTEKYLGVWNLRDCPDSFDFDVVRQKCLERKVMRRQQATCAKNPNTVGCSTPCLGKPFEFLHTYFKISFKFLGKKLLFLDAAASPKIGSPCDWHEASLLPDPKSNGFFYQCAPQTSSASCGEWTRVPCATNTVFSPRLSVCVLATENANSCEAQQEPVCNCAQTAGATQCPGISTCTKNVCCQEKDVLDNFIQHQAPLCPGSNVPPFGSCNEACPQYSACAPGIGCCPVPVNQPKQSIQITLCPGSFSPPLGSCSSCPTGTSCNSAINACCPSSTRPSTDIVYNVVQLCPSNKNRLDGSPSLQPCSAGCQPGNACYQGACCPMTCPAGQTALGFCSSGGCTSGSCYIPGGSCCQEVIKLPVCPNGQQSLRRCSVNQECGARMECSSGGCCPMPFCPTGVQHLYGRTLLSVTPLSERNYLTRTLDCGRVGVECANGACCPLPTCPNNVVSTQRCAVGCANCCPMGNTCINGGCCPLPQCPSGGLALSICAGRGCPVGTECVGGGCCQLPRCPSGLQATQRCQMGIGCARGHQCENGVCCAMPMCSTGMIASSVCGIGNSCPMGYDEDAVRNHHHYVQMVVGLLRDVIEVLNVLQDLAVRHWEDAAFYRWSRSVLVSSIQSVNVHRTVLVQVALPVQWGRVAPRIPGSQCHASTQCNGYSSSCAQCTQGVCACVNGAASNGASCLQMPNKVLVVARNGCDQYGSPCRVLLSTARRRPIIAPVGNITETPLFFNVANERRCVANATDFAFDPDSTCLPNEKCINGECKMKLWPGEYGCTTDEECTSRCANTYCERMKSDKNVAQCQCRDGQLLYGRCFSQCPQGFHESGAYCMHDNEDAFWADADAQDRLKALLNAGQC